MPPRKSTRKPTRKAAHPVVQTPGGGIGDSPITLTLSQFDALRNDVVTANERARGLEQELAVAKSTDPAGRIERLTSLAKHLLDVARFAVANLPPSEVPRWPWGALALAADDIIHLPDYGEDERVLALEFRAFADEARQAEAGRDVRGGGLPKAAPDTAIVKAELDMPSRHQDGWEVVVNDDRVKLSSTVE